MDHHHLFMFRIEDCKNLNTIIQKSENHQTPLIIVLLCGCYVYIFFCVHALYLINIFCLYINSELQNKDTRSHSRLSIIYNHNNNDDNDDDDKHFKN